MTTIDQHTTDQHTTDQHTTDRRAAFDAEALAQLDALFGFALKLTRSRVDAEDLVSDTLARALERWEQFRPGTSIRAWLFTILYHLFVSARRVAGREVLAEDIGGAGGDAGHAPRGDRLELAAWRAHQHAGETDPEQRFYDSFLDEEVTRAVEALPEEYRVTVVLSDLEDLRYAEIAAALGIPEGTVKSRLFRGRKLLKERLASYALEMGYIRRATLARERRAQAAFGELALLTA